jgi:hypothetical protein
VTERPTPHDVRRRAGVRRNVADVIRNILRYRARTHGIEIATAARAVKRIVV